jgi:NADPH:quinone reductase-like Zn-dependent oxidoreductase
MLCTIINYCIINRGYSTAILCIIAALLLQVATAGGPDKVVMLKRLGVDRVVDYKQESLKVSECVEDNKSRREHSWVVCLL